MEKSRIRAILGFLLLCHSVSSLVLTGPSVHAARLGSDALVPCTFTVDNPPVEPKHLIIIWLFQDKEILSYDETVKMTSSRYSLSTEVLSTGNANLTISNIQILDGGMYKCSVIYRADRKEKEVRLDIGAPPQVTVTNKSVIMNEESVLRCSVTGFYPVDIDVKWFQDGKRLNIIPVEHSWRNLDRTYNVNSSVTITPTEEDRARNFSCRVQHEFLQRPHQEDFRLVYEEGTSAGIIAACVIVPILIIIIITVLWWRLKLRRKVSTPSFIIRDIESPHKLIDGEEAVLYCTMDNSPEDLRVTWLIRRAGEIQEIQTSQTGEEEEESLLDKSYMVRSQREGRQYITSLLFIPHMERHKDVTFICRGVFKKHKDEKMFHCKTVYVKPKLLHPITRSLKTPAEMMYSINLEKFYPKRIKMIWSYIVGGSETRVPSGESISDNPEGTYNVLSEAQLLEDLLKDPRLIVRVTWEHESMQEPESRELSIRDSDYRWRPVVEEIQIPRLLHGTPAALQCNISGYFPNGVIVEWQRRVGHNIYEKTDAAGNQSVIPRRASDNTYSCTARLTITPTLRTHQGAEYICLVEHPALEKPIETRTGRIQVIAKPQMLASIKITMGYLSRVQFSLNLQNFYPKDITVSWHWEDKSGNHRLSAEEKTTIQDDLTHDVTSVVRISNHAFKDPEIKIIVLWKHEAMEIPETRSLSIRDLPWHPYVGTINVPKLEDGKQATLSCDISGYFPDLLSVSWFLKKDDNETALPIEPSKTGRMYKISHKERQKDKTYNYEASLSFTPLRSSDQGSEIICRVEHPSLECPIKRSTGPLHIDLPWRPLVGSINVPKLEDGKQATLSCDISGYFPDLLSVSWFLKDDKETALPKEPLKTERTYKISHKERQKDKTYSYEASLSFTVLRSSDHGSEIICRVEHPSLECPIERSTGPLHIDARTKSFGSFRQSVKKTFGIGTKNDRAEEGEEVTEHIGAGPQEEGKYSAPEKEKETLGIGTKNDGAEGGEEVTEHIGAGHQEEGTYSAPENDDGS